MCLVHQSVSLPSHFTQHRSLADLSFSSGNQNDLNRRVAFEETNQDLVMSDDMDFQLETGDSSPSSLSRRIGHLFGLSGNEDSTVHLAEYLPQQSPRKGSRKIPHPGLFSSLNEDTTKIVPNKAVHALESSPVSAMLPTEDEDINETSDNKKNIRDQSRQFTKTAITWILEMQGARFKNVLSKALRAVPEKRVPGPQMSVGLDLRVLRGMLRTQQNRRKAEDSPSMSRLFNIG